MSTLDRYRKRGGFRQLLELIESSVAKKKESLLAVVEKEDRVWAGRIKDRMMTMDKVIQWDGEQLEKIFTKFPEEIWVKCLFVKENPIMRKALATKVSQFMSGPQQKRVHEILEDLQPTSGEVEAACIMVIKKIREMQKEGSFKPEIFDPKCALSDLEEVK